MAKFQQGQSGNPGGRPPSNLNKLLSQYLHAKSSDNKTRELKLVEKIYNLALSGDMRAVALIWDRMEGKGAEPLDSLSNGPIRFVLYDPEKHGQPGDTGNKEQEK